MKIAKSVIPLLNSPKVRFALALALGFTEQWINKVIDRNKVNGPLTTVTALKIIREELNLTDEEILEPAQVEAEAEK